MKLWSTYPAGQFVPQPGDRHNWHVWHVADALAVLESGDHLAFLEHNPEKSFTINFANGSYAAIKPGDPLWEKLKEIAATYLVEVFPADLWAKGYVPWSGEEGSPGAFDAISLSLKPIT